MIELETATRPTTELTVQINLVYSHANYNDTMEDLQQNTKEHITTAIYLMYYWYLLKW